MALRTTFQEVVQMVRNESRLSTNTSRGIDHLDHIKQLVRRHYLTLAEDYDWPHLRIKKESSEGRKVLAAGQRYYNFPVNLNPLKIERAVVKFGNQWLPVEYGINYTDQYSAMDPDSNQRTDPVTNWTFYTDAMFEVWPLPASNGVANGNNEIAFEGQKNVELLVADTNRLDMDDMLISLMCSSEILAANDQKTAAEVKGQAAMARLGRLRANLRDRTRYAMGLGQVRNSAHMWPRHPDYIRGR